MLNKVIEFVQTHELLQPRDRVLVAVSGGVDSMVLLHVFCALRETFKLTLCVAHLDHELRETSAADAGFVKAAAQRLGLSFTGRAEAVALHARQTKQSLEAAAREVRRAFLREAALAERCGAIALGHHANDQAETFLLNLVRGAGPQGLAGMRPHNGLFIRPLLACSRQEIEEYAARAGIEYRQDPSNRDLRFSRNRIRWQVLPVLQQLNPNLIETLGKDQALLGQYADYVRAQAQRALHQILTKQRDQLVCVDRPGFCKLPLALRSAIVRLVFEQLTGSQRRLSFVHVQAALAQAQSGNSGKTIEFPQSLIMRVSGDLLRFQRRSDRLSSPNTPLRVPGVTHWQDWAFAATVAPKAKSAFLPSGRRKQDRLSVQLDWGTIEPPLVIRSRQSGDRIDPLGLNGRKKIQDIFVDAKVPRDHRDGVPIVEDQRGIVWVVGYCQSKRNKLTSSTRKVLTVDAKSLNDANKME